MANFFNYLSSNPKLIIAIKIFSIFFLAFIAFFITRKILFRAITRIVEKTETKIDDIFLERKILNKISYLSPIFILYYFAGYVEAYVDELRTTGKIFILFFIVAAINEFLNKFEFFAKQIPELKNKPIKSYTQLLKLLLYIIAIVIIIGILTNQSPYALLGGIGAMTAVLLFIFRDTILSFIASVQISTYDLVRVGDWIEAPKFGADGDVIEVNLHTIKVQNFDKTITTIPTYRLIEESFKNWRGMQDTGARRIKRHLLIDQTSVKILDEQLIEKLSKLQLIKQYIENRKKEIEEYNKRNNIDKSIPINGRQMTNLGTFRKYIEEYLAKNSNIHKDFTLLVRHLQPTPQGLPIEIYAFANDTNWVNYEKIQADIFDHLLAVIPYFELRVFQEPSGNDLQEGFKSLNFTKN